MNVFSPVSSHPFLSLAFIFLAIGLISFFIFLFWKPRKKFLIIFPLLFFFLFGGALVKSFGDKGLYLHLNQPFMLVHNQPLKLPNGEISGQNFYIMGLSSERDYSLEELENILDKRRKDPILVYFDIVTVENQLEEKTETKMEKFQVSLEQIQDLGLEEDYYALLDKYEQALEVFFKENNQ